PREEWLAFIPQAHEGYVSWEEFERIRQTMATNVRGWQRTGAATNGPALLAGLLRCRRCGRKLVVCYTGNAHNVLRYVCVRGARDNGEPRCISFGGVVVDDAMAKEILHVVQPGAIEAGGVAREAAAHEQDADVRLKKRIVRTLIHEVVVDVDADAGEVILVIHWKGGVHTELRLPRRRRGQNSTQTSKDIIDAVRILARICPDDLLANVLNRNGLLTGRGNRWTRERVVSLRTHHDIACYDRDRR